MYCICAYIQGLHTTPLSSYMYLRVSKLSSIRADNLNDKSNPYIIISLVVGLHINIKRITMIDVAVTYMAYTCVPTLSHNSW